VDLENKMEQYLITYILIVDKMWKIKYWVSAR